ncbi:LA2681 family HEPN domain-containing protein [Nitrospira moscoviensis]|nr:LA2681 family HEPN domain-containing protein [Nitrospira moscoviensis]
MNKVVDTKDVERRFRECHATLNALIDQDPRLAIEAARALTPDDVLNGRDLNALRVGILIDGGIAANDVRAVDEGVNLLQRLLDSDPNRGDLQYSLANGLTGKADLRSYSGPAWYCDTADLRRKARRLYRFAEEGEAGSFIASQALTNLGNALIKAYRSVEAYDCYLSALESDPTNGVALTGAAKILLRFANEGTGNRDVLLGVAARHLRTARENRERIRELAGEQAYKQLSELIETRTESGALPNLSSATNYQRFVAKHRLALTPTIEGLDLAMQRWDSLHIETITETINTEHGVPPIFAMFNVLKADYLTARFLAYLALEEELTDSGKYSDTLDYATYGIRSSVLTLSQRSCMDVLDKTAVAASEYLGLPGDPKSIDFQTRWFVKPKRDEPLTWQPEIHREIALGNTALIALTEVSYDLPEGGFLQNKRSIRNTSTHRFAVLHDFGAKSSRECRHIDHYERGAFENQLIETLQLTRAVLFYFVEMIKLREKRLSKGSPLTMRLCVPDHD